MPDAVRRTVHPITDHQVAGLDVETPERFATVCIRQLRLGETAARQLDVDVQPEVGAIATVMLLIGH